MTSIRSPEVMSRVCAYQPDVVILSLGGNDLDKRYANTEAVKGKRSFVMVLSFVLPVFRCTYLQVTNDGPQ